MGKIKELGLDGKYQYDESHMLGSGAFASVYEGIQKDTKIKIAVKVISKKGIEKYGEKMKAAIQNEVTILSKMKGKGGQKHIMGIYDCFQTSNHIYIILELCTGGSLGEILKIDKKVGEKESKGIVVQVLLALQHLESLGVAHRDLKPDNLLLHEGVYKVGDFGFASQKDLLNTTLGTPPYMAPEFYSASEYNMKVDVWALGVIFHEMLFGQLFFLDGATTAFQVQNNIINRPYTITSEQKVTISDECQEVLYLMLDKDPQKRYSASQLLDHPFFQLNSSTTIAKAYSKRLYNFLDGINFLLHTITQLTINNFSISKFAILALAQKANFLIQTQYQNLINTVDKSQQANTFYLSEYYSQVMKEFQKTSQSVLQIYNVVRNKINQFIGSNALNLNQRELQFSQQCFISIQTDKSNKQQDDFYLLQLNDTADLIFQQSQRQQNRNQIELAYRLFICQKFDNILCNLNYEFINLKEVVEKQNYDEFKQLYQQKQLIMF